MMSRKTTLTKAPPCKKYLRWTVPWAVVQLSQRVSERVVAQSCQWEHLAWGVSPGGSAEGRRGDHLQPHPSCRAGRQPSPRGPGTISRIPFAKCRASQRSTRWPPHGFCIMGPSLCRNLYQCFILNSFVVLLISQAVLRATKVKSGYLFCTTGV